MLRGSGTTFLCESWEHRNGEMDQSRECFKRQRDQLLDRIKQLEDRIHRASMAFFRDGSDGHVASQMLAILEEERDKP